MLLEERAGGKVTQKERSQKAGRAAGPGQVRTRWEGAARPSRRASGLGRPQGPGFSELLSSSPPIVVVTILALYCCVTKHPKTQWPETRFIYFAYEFGQSLAGTACVCFMMPGASAWISGARSQLVAPIHVFQS